MNRKKGKRRATKPIGHYSKSLFQATENESEALGISVQSILNIQSEATMLKHMTEPRLTFFCMPWGFDASELPAIIIQVCPPCEISSRRSPPRFEAGIRCPSEVHRGTNSNLQRKLVTPSLHHFKHHFKFQGKNETTNYQQGVDMVALVREVSSIEAM